jgi:C-terminal processing protease CtpA/Prc
MVNFDMIGRFGSDKFTVYGVQSGKEFSELVTRAAEQAGIDFRASMGGFFEASDHASFYAHDIPVLFAFTGIHKQYHRPEDRWELIDADGAAKVLTMFHAVVRELANLPAGPTFQPRPAEAETEMEEPPVKPGVEHEKEAREKEEQVQPGGSEEEGRAKPRLRLGIVPDFGASSSSGVVIASVVEGGPAKAAGVQAGDRLIKIGDHEIKDVYGYMAALGESRPGETLELLVVRKEQEVRLQVKLPEAPKSRGAH